MQTLYSDWLRLGQLIKLSSLENELLGLLPGEVGVSPAEVAVLGRLLVDRSEEVEFLNDVARAEVEVLANDADEVLISKAILHCAVGLDVNGERVGETDGVGDLDKDSVSEASSDQGLGNVSCVVGS